MKNNINPAQMLEETNSYPVTYMRFIKIYSANKHRMFCFVEGDDDECYYKSRASYKEELLFLPCNGKRNVVDIHNIISENEYKKAKTVYFIDKDYDISIKSKYKLIYETPCYSIENFYTSKGAFEKIVEYIFGIHKGENNFSIIVELFNKLQKEFHHMITELNAWIYFQREEERRMGQDRKINLDKIKYDSLCRINLEGINRTYTIESIQKEISDFYQVDNEQLTKICEVLDNADKQSIYRGKYEFYFLTKFLDAVITEYNKSRKGTSQIFEKADKMKMITFNISNNSRDLMNQLALFADTPNCLVEYFEQINRYYGEVV